MLGDVEQRTSHAAREAGKETNDMALTCPDKDLAQFQIGPGTSESERRSRAGPPLLMCQFVEKRRGVEASSEDQPLPKQSRV